MHFENGREAPWRGAMALSLATTLLLSACAADNEPRGSEPHATSVSEETNAPIPNEQVQRAGEMEPEALWSKIGEILDDPSTPQPKGGTYADFMSSISGETNNDAMITIGAEQLTCADVTERSSPDQTCQVDSLRQQIFSEYASDLENWVENSKYIPEHVPGHVAVSLALNMAENGLASSAGDMRLPHEALIGLEAIRLDNAKVYGTTMTLEEYTKLYADVRYNTYEVEEQPTSIAEWQNRQTGQVSNEVEPTTEPTPDRPETTLMESILDDAESNVDPSLTTIELGGVTYTCGEMLGHASKGHVCDQEEEQLLKSLKSHAPAIIERAGGLDESISIPIAFHLLRAEQKGYLGNLVLASISTGLAESSPAGLKEVPEDAYISTVAQALGIDDPQIIGMR